MEDSIDGHVLQTYMYSMPTLNMFMDVHVCDVSKYIIFTDIVEKVRSETVPPFRPFVNENSCHPALLELMHHCLSEEPSARPDFNAIKTHIRNMSGYVCRSLYCTIQDYS